MKAENTVILQVPGCSHAMFPGMAKCSDGAFLLQCNAGSDFEGSDCSMYQFRSTDGGKNWHFEGNIAEMKQLPFSEPFSCTSKPSVLQDGTLISGGYGFRRDMPEMGLSDYSAKFGRYPEMFNFVLRSTDNGKTWGEYEWIRHDYAGIENSGPMLRLKDGTLLFTGVPFVLNAPLNRGLVFSGDADGKNFKECGCFFEDRNIAAFETRAVQLQDGTIALIFWAYDLKNDKNLNNHIVISKDNGRTWGKALDLGIAGQAANLFTAENRLFSVQARREGKDLGIYMNEIFLKEDAVSTGEDILLWSANGTTGKSGDINERFVSLKFGQPSVLIDGEKMFLVFWSAVTGTYRIEIHSFDLNNI